MKMIFYTSITDYKKNHIHFNVIIEVRMVRIIDAMQQMIWKYWDELDINSFNKRL